MSFPYGKCLALNEDCMGIQGGQIDNIAKSLASFPVFAALSHQEREQLAQSAVRRSYQKGECVAHGGDVWPYVIILANGELHALMTSPSGRSLGVLKIQAGEEFWSPSLFNGIPLPTTLEVWKPSVIYFLHQNQVLPLVRRNTEALWKLSVELARRLQKKSVLVEEIAFFSISEKMARLLLNWFEGAASSRVTRDISLDEMGSMIGTTSVMVCKQLSRFAEDGLIEVSRTEFRLRDKTGLERIAGVK